MFFAHKGTAVTLVTKTAKRYEGIIASATENEGDTTGVTLRDVKELTAPGAPVKSQLFIASTNIDSWSPVSANSNTSVPPPSTTNPRTDPKERTLLQTLAGLTVCDIYNAHMALHIDRFNQGTTITLSTKTARRYEGVVASTTGERNVAGLTLRDVKELSAPGAPLKDQLFIAAPDIDTWSSGPADAKVPNGDCRRNQLFMHLFSRLAFCFVAFKTDTDISQKAPRRERELQAWHADLPTSAVGTAGPTHGHHTDDVTFGAGSAGNAGWNQFTANEKLFGVKTGFDEELYTTKLDRSGADFAERERRAQALANEIMRVR